MSGPIQTQFRRHQQPGWPGVLSRPNEPFSFDTGPLHVPSSGRKARPGDGVIWEATQNQYKVAATAAEELLVLGIVAYDPATIQETLSAIPSGANSPAYVEYDDNAIIKVLVFGSIFVTAGGACEYGQLMRYQEDDFKWDADDPTSYAETYHRSVECVSRSGVDGGIIEVRIGYGRTN